MNGASGEGGGGGGVGDDKVGLRNCYSVIERKEW